MTVFILSGLIGSGKSTKAKDIKSKLDNCVIVSRDDLREMIHGKYLFDVKYETFIKDLNEQFIFLAIYHGYNIVIDETHLTRKSRKKIINTIRNVGKPVSIKIVHCTENKNNIENRKKHDLRGYTVSKWEEVLKKHLEIYEPVTKKECDDLGVGYEEWSIV